jgi:hypothetical protein
MDFERSKAFELDRSRGFELDRPRASSVDKDEYAVACGTTRRKKNPIKSIVNVPTARRSRNWEGSFSNANEDKVAKKKALSP